ncbi:hypothetical protein PQ478_19560 [Alkalihalophilus pseudofirmus]|uniref:hypothetical protein n=1 Tax=Alkalihalophilus pseudofirmus TaxID=79885 RepID=UPI00259B430C|nr:hypothetical protein [Alkalihalophilus pseudofirmus]WEG16677.1 hypothetical protein PQ478_19560 [Alkalihalophilus pseudofirmus]
MLSPSKDQAVVKVIEVGSCVIVLELDMGKVIELTEAVLIEKGRVRQKFIGFPLIERYMPEAMSMLRREIDLKRAIL